ncbi:MAG: hypothetical protein COS37_00435 [Anaerolineae bacterium CG03_land_8_20_14_0_80_58_20]|nr:MAG: hypothetical protein COS37_00435 [Anaerolineae bacterium CG03_land_8_20_14_0_80_58_20]
MRNKLFLKLILIALAMILLVTACAAENRDYRVTTNGEEKILDHQTYGSCVTEMALDGIRVYCIVGNLKVYDAIVDTFEVLPVEEGGWLK